MQLRAAVVTAAVLTSTLALAQGQQRLPRQTVSVELAGQQVTIDYGRPQLRGRTLGELLKQLPADRIWRAGENQVTTLTTTADLSIAGKTVPAGKYSLYVHAPEAGDWALVLNSDPGIPLGKIWAQAPPDQAQALWPRLDGYDKVLATEVLRVPMTKGSGETAEAFTIALSATGDGAGLSMAWGDQHWSLDLKAAK
jgi:hypothetical protein